MCIRDSPSLRSPLLLPLERLRASTGRATAIFAVSAAGYGCIAAVYGTRCGRLWRHMRHVLGVTCSG
eukprot:2042787-Rhodomonas_salina.1